ncbi:hypothetical protein, partial [Rhodanobacter lindaniclasticus]
MASQWRFNGDGTRAICLRDYGLLADYSVLYATVGIQTKTGTWPRAVELQFHLTADATTTGERIAGALQFDTVDVYAASVDSGCSWAGFVATTDASLAGTTISDTYDPNGNSGYSVTWKLVADGPKNFLASGTNVVPNPTTDGLGGSFINTTDLLTELGA